jgi:hypothetical protein
VRFLCLFCGAVVVAFLFPRWVIFTFLHIHKNVEKKDRKKARNEKKSALTATASIRMPLSDVCEWEIIVMRAKSYVTVLCVNENDENSIACQIFMKRWIIILPSNSTAVSQWI